MANSLFLQIDSSRCAQVTQSKDYQVDARWGSQCSYVTQRVRDTLELQPEYSEQAQIKPLVPIVQQCRLLRWSD